MQTKNYLQSKMQYLGILLLALVVTSCGSYQYAGYDEDPIYGEDRRTYDYPAENEERVVEARQTAQEEDKSDNGYYSNYFKEKSLQYEGINDQDVIFTDIDSYEGSYNEAQDSTQYRGGYGGWGEDHNDDVVINIYGGHAFNSIWWNRPWGWNAGWGWGWNNWGWNTGWGWGWNNWGWNAGWGWGWNNWGWGGGFGWGWNAWNPFWCPPAWGGGFYGNYGYYNRNVAFVNSRRSAINNGSLASLSRRSSLNNNISRRGDYNSTVRRGTTARRTDARRGNNTYRTRPSANTSRNRPNTTSRNRPNTTSRNRPNTTSRNRPNTTSRNRPANTQRYRPNTSSRSKPTTTRRSGGRSFNNRSGGSRSSSFGRSGGGMRSSGGGRSGGGGRRGGRM